MYVCVLYFIWKDNIELFTILPAKREYAYNGNFFLYLFLV